MKTLLTAERNVRRVVFKSLWKMFDVKSLTDLALFAIGIVSMAGLGYIMITGFINNF
jgi:hypothetical protein